MDGLILVDKPEGWTSHDAVSYIRGVLEEKRVGHTGTLDPAATGLLLVLVGRATRLARYFGPDDKEYLAVMRLGAETDTQDGEGKVIRECHVPALTASDVLAVFARFTGEISQTPPMYSAIKRGGRPLYAHARAGRTVEVGPRRVFVHRLELTRLDGPLVEFKTLCSKGTYIRTLARDMGEALGSCAHLFSLRRTHVGGHRVEDAIPLAGRPGAEEILEKALPLTEMLPGFPSVVVNDSAARRVGDGRAPAREDMAAFPEGLETGAPVRVLGPDGRMLAVAEATSEYGDPLVLRVVLA